MELCEGSVYFRQIGITAVFDDLNESMSISQGWKKSSVIDIQYRYSLLFCHRKYQRLYFFGW